MAFEPTREGQLTEKQLKWGHWWVTHKLQLKALLTVTIGIIAFSLLTYAVYGFADWFFGSGVEERAAIAQMANAPTGYPAIQAQSRPRQVSIDPATTLISGPDSYDLVSRVLNPNNDWWLELDWHFDSAGKALGNKQTTTILPGGSGWLLQLGFKSPFMPVGVNLVVDELRWRRLDKHRVRPDYASWAGERLDIQITEPTFSPPKPDDPLSVSRARFNVVNNTGYGYWRMGFFVTLWNGTSLVGINHVTVSQLRAGETRPVDASWFSALSKVTEIRVAPEINIFDEAVYMPVRP